MYDAIHDHPSTKDAIRLAVFLPNTFQDTWPIAKIFCCSDCNVIIQAIGNQDTSERNQSFSIVRKLSIYVLRPISTEMNTLLDLYPCDILSHYRFAQDPVTIASSSPTCTSWNTPSTTQDNARYFVQSVLAFFGKLHLAHLVPL